MRNRKSSEHNIELPSLPHWLVLKAPVNTSNMSRERFMTREGILLSLMRKMMAIVRIVAERLTGPYIHVCLYMIRIVHRYGRTRFKIGDPAFRLTHSDSSMAPPTLINIRNYIDAFLALISGDHGLNEFPIVGDPGCATSVLRQIF